MFSTKKSKNVSESAEGRDCAAPPKYQDPKKESCGLFLVSGEKPADQCNIDIIAIHGLRGNWRQTWTTKDGIFWLEDFLPTQFPNARIMSYGYNGDILQSKAVTNVTNEAEIFIRYIANNRKLPEEQIRPIIFICHSLGGIITKKAVIIAHGKAHFYSNLFQSIKGVIFLGVPHRGAALAAPARHTVNFLHQLGFDANTNHLGSLRLDAEDLLAISAQFADIAAPLDIVTFYETETYMKQLIVDENSARLGTRNEQVCGIPGTNHRTICRFARIDCKKYELVWKAVEHLMEGAIQAKSDSTVHLDQGHIYIPVKYSSRHFTGREDYLNDLAAFFKRRLDGQDTCRREFFLYGMGGAGKTQICLKFVEQHNNLFWKVFWADATSTQTLELSFQDIATDPIAKREGVDGSSKSIVRWLSRTDSEWLLVLDNADGDFDVISPYLPAGRRGNILITTRNHNFKPCTRISTSREVLAMDDSDACTLLGRVANLDATAVDTMNTQIQSIVAELHSVALAIDHAGCAISDGVCDLRDYVSMLKTHRTELLDNTAFRGASDYNQTLYSTLNLSVSVIEKRAQRDLQPTSSAEHTAIQLLNIFAAFHYNGIMEETFRRSAEQNYLESVSLNEIKSKSLSCAAEYLPRNILQVNRDGNWDPLVFREGIRILRTFSLICMDKGQRTYSIHPLIHYWSRTRLNSTDRSKTCQSANAILSASITMEQSSQDFQYCRRLLPHIISLKKCHEEMAVDEKYYDDAYAKYSHIYFENGYIKEAHQFAIKIKEVRTHLLGEKHRLTLTAAENLAATLRESGTKGALNQAKILHEHIHNLRAEILGDSHLETLGSKYELGSVYTHTSEFKKAEKYLYQAWRGRRSQLGGNNRDTLKTEMLLSGVYRHLARYKEAEELQRKTLAIAIEALGEMDPDTIMAMANLAATLSNIDDKVLEAEELKIKILALRKRVLGENHPETLMAQANLASTYCQQKRWKETEALLLPLINKRIVTLGEEHRETLRARLMLANCLLGQGRLNEAENECTQVVTRRKETLSECHSHTLWSMHKLACIYEAQGRLTDAIALWEQTLASQVEKDGLGEDHWETQEVMHHLASALYCQGQAKEAIFMIERVLNLKKRRLQDDSDNPSILVSAKLLERWQKQKD